MISRSLPVAHALSETTGMSVAIGSLCSISTTGTSVRAKQIITEDLAKKHRKMGQNRARFAA